MGRIFLDHINGIKLYSCASCDTNLTNKSELISTRFTGATGKLSQFILLVLLFLFQYCGIGKLSGKVVMCECVCVCCHLKTMYMFALSEFANGQEEIIVDWSVRLFVLLIWNLRISF